MTPYTEYSNGHHEARVKDDTGRLFAACRHKHKTLGAAQVCAERMARRAGWKPSKTYAVRTVRFGTILRSDDSIRSARRWAEKAFPKEVQSVEYAGGG